MCCVVITYVAVDSPEVTTLFPTVIALSVVVALIVIELMYSVPSIVALEPSIVSPEVLALKSNCRIYPLIY